MTAERLVTPIYLDTNALLDLLASLDNGFSFVEKISSWAESSRETHQSVKGEAGTEFGVPNVFSMLKINLGRVADGRRSANTEQQREAERYHTYGSLLYRMRETLNSQGLIKQFDGTADSWKNIKLMDFVELNGLLKPNPFTESINTIDRFAAIMEIYVAVQSKLSIPPATGQSRKQAFSQSASAEKA